MDKIIYPYIRFSTKKQEHGHSLTRQITRIKEYALENGYKINDSLELRDLGKSGFKGLNAKEGALSVFLKLLEDEKIPKDGSAYLCIEQFDRLSRMPTDDAYQVFRKILKQNVNIITLMDEKVYRKEDLNNMVSILNSLILMEQAHLESQRKSDLISQIFKGKVKTLKSGGKVQFTYILPGWIDNNGTKEEPDFVVNEKVEVVKMIVDMYLGGETMGHIARILNENQTPQIARKRTKNQTNSWNSAKISHLLTNQTLLGKLHIRTTGDIIEDYYPAVISKDQWDLIQAKKRTQSVTKVAGRRSINIFQGRMFCADCGNKYYFETDDKKGKNGKRYVYHMLKCSGRRFHSCDSESLKYDTMTNPDLFFFRN
ncbi:recombinase family protein, partial [Vibrio alginolyticus]|nr:recombinase family protein [Vibrio alginolyticus]